MIGLVRCAAAVGRQPVGEAHGEPLAQPVDDRVGVERPHDFISVRPSSWFLPSTRGWLGSAVQGVLDEPLERRVLLLDDDDLVEPAGEAAHQLGIERHGHAQLEEADPGRGDRPLAVQAEPAEGLEQLEVREAGGDEADPGVVRVDGDRGSAGSRRRSAGRSAGGSRGTPARPRASVPTEEVRRRVARPRHAVEAVVGMIGSASSTGKSTVPDAVGDRGDDLHRRPQSRRSATWRPRADRARGTPRRCRGRGSACAGRRAWRPTRTASSTSCTPGRRRRARPPPPFGLAPANTPWRRASPARSSPGALPYQMPRTPSYRASGRPGASCEPITAVAPSSSLTAGWWTIGRSGTRAPSARHLVVEPAER